MTVLRVTDLSVQYRTRATPRGRPGTPASDTTGAQPAPGVRHVSFAIEPGELVAIVGETGSGKTTATLAALGLLPDAAQRTGGRIDVLGHDVTHWNRRRFRSLHGTHIGYVPQDPTSSLDPLRTIGSQVGEAARIHRSDAAPHAVTDLLARVGIHDVDRVARSYPHELSGGQRQRALIAGAIALRPQLLVADESTSALDVTVQRRVLDLVDELRQVDGTGVLLVTHDLAVAAERADRIVVLRHGQVQDMGTTAEIMLGDTSAYTRELLASAPALRTPRPRVVLAERAAANPEAAATTEASARAAIAVTGASKRFGRDGAVRAVNDVSFTVTPGTTHAIVGESGSGKTTLARLVMGLVSPSSGSIRVAGHELQGARTRAEQRAFRRSTQLVYQSPFASLNPSQRIIDTVAEPIRNFAGVSRREAHAQAAALLDRMSLPAALHHRAPSELSGGQRQRVAIARALAPQPSVLVLDEAVSALDVSVQARILDLLDELQRERGLTYLFISHDLSVVREISDTVSVMRHGEIVEHAPTAELFAAPSHPYTRELLRAIPHVDPALLPHSRSRS